MKVSKLRCVLVPNTICSCVTPARGSICPFYWETESHTNNGDIYSRFSVCGSQGQGSGLGSLVNSLWDAIDKLPSALVCAHWCSNLIKHQFNDPGISKYQNRNVLPTNRKHVFSWNTYSNEARIIQKHSALFSSFMCINVTRCCWSVNHRSLGGARTHSRFTALHLTCSTENIPEILYFVDHYYFSRLRPFQSMSGHARCGTPLWEMVQPALQVWRHRLPWSHHATAPQNLKCFHRIARRGDCSGGLTSLADERVLRCEAWHRPSGARDSVWTASSAILDASLMKQPQRLMVIITLLLSLRSLISP